MIYAFLWRFLIPASWLRRGGRRERLAFRAYGAAWMRAERRRYPAVRSIYQFKGRAHE